MSKFIPKEPANRVNVSGNKPVLHEFMELFIGSVGILVVLYFVCGVALDIIVDKLPAKFEKSMVKVIDFSQFETPFYYVDAEIEAQKLLNDLVQKSSLKGQSFQLRVSDNQKINALALPGNNIVVFAGLLDEVQSENALVFVLAHELGHYKNRDHLRGLGRAAVFTFLSVAVLGSNNAITNFFSRSFSLVDLRFSRKQELEADKFAFTLLNRKYGHVGGVKRFFHKLEADSDYKFLQYFSTHPLHSKRIESMQEFQQTMGFQEDPVKPLDKDKYRRAYVEEKSEQEM